MKTKKQPARCMITFEMRDDVYTSAKTAATRLGMTLDEFVEMALREMLETGAPAS